ncbi:MAG TPA: hypothetical protein PKK61_01450 [Defluviitaleaceae bacterium]|nr:hypothetical protein [Candidatus Epulonipiscium sp.]HOA79717.1 hypothetical protein [Defluviitaleaceae bacterium]
MKKYKLALSYYLPSVLTMIILNLLILLIYFDTYKGEYSIHNFKLYLLFIVLVNIPLIINIIYIKSTYYCIDNEGIIEKTIIKEKKILWNEIIFITLTNNAGVNRPGIDLMIASKDTNINIHYQAYDFDEIYHRVLTGREELLKGPWTLSSIKLPISDKKALIIMCLFGISAIIFLTLMALFL